MAKDALEGYIEVIAEMGGTLPVPTNIRDIAVDNGCVMYVVADVDLAHKKNGDALIQQLSAL